MVAKSKNATGKKSKTVKLDVQVKRKVTQSGQHYVSSGQCISRTAKGKPCMNPVGMAGVPYCKACIKTGDPALKLFRHPKAGLCLVAAQNLRKGYRVALWGNKTKKKDMTEKGMEWAFDIGQGWYIDPTPHKGSMIQYCPCAGPSEVAVVTADSFSFGEKHGSLIFKTTAPLKKNWQLTMCYGVNSKDSNTFFEERGIVRGDCGTAKHPTMQRKVLAKKKAKNPSMKKVAMKSAAKMKASMKKKAAKK